MCAACGFSCCDSDEHVGCGCGHCDHPDCQPPDLDQDLPIGDEPEEREEMQCCRAA
jgi:hypothetical protein